jgi:hypothetical protein
MGKCAYMYILNLSDELDGTLEVASAVDVYVFAVKT